MLLLGYAPLAVAIVRSADRLTAAGDPVAVVVLWGAFVAFMALRAAILRVRARTDAWMVTGAR